MRSVVEHRPLGERGGIPLADGSRPQEGIQVTPDQLDPALFCQDTSLPSLIRGDFMAGQGPPGMCWTEAAFGCPVSIVTGGPWAEAFIDDWRQTPPPAPDPLWIDKLEEFVEFLVARAAGQLPVTQPLFRGPVDMMFAGLGHEEACMAVKTAPDRSDAYLAACAELFIEIAQRRIDKTPTFEGGYLSSYGIWAPGTVVRTQVDNASMLSPETYRERVLPFDRLVFEAFDVTLIHLHSCCLHIIDDLVKEDALDCIQVSIDYPGGPLAREVMPRLQRILEAKPLIVTGPVHQAELDQLEQLKPAGGLCLNVQCVPDDQHTV
ncbi:MAG: hypothetical protein HOH74_29245 [Gemmatimonadetes bacterium]|nr:hypothetical protein [Gemmatimonadota bacterium]MBT6149561.1 hypothetical protein [Gemmatimonadota bacterium]